jgi:hypothetical protein
MPLHHQSWARSFFCRLGDINVTADEIKALDHAVNRYGHDSLVFAMLYVTG